MTSALLTVALLIPAADPPKLTEAAQKELKNFEGKWKVTKEISPEGEMEPMRDGEEVVLEFKGPKIVFGGKEKLEFQVSALDPSTDPKCIDLKCQTEKGPIPQGFVLEAIYKFDGDTLTLAGYAGDGKKRPANFDAPKDQGAGMWILKRVKE